MNFSSLYLNAKSAVEKALNNIWTSETANPAQEETAKRIKEITKNILVDEDSMPIVQCMNSYKTVFSVKGTEAENLVFPLWDVISPQGPKHYFPYEHQYECWKTLLTDKSSNGKPMSICVTTGTGSGKTECFMLPLVKDLLQVNNEIKEESVKAIFIYPLNALMEDQKERLEKLLANTDLTYTVYNGDLPEREPEPNDVSEEAERLRKKINEVRGLVTDQEGNAILDANGNPQFLFPKLVYTREAVRNNPPDILLTNPTMLEYILLRKKDESLIKPLLRSLRWIAIDETHTYVGAGAAEMAMLLRRVCLAFGVKPQNIRFATSSATFSNENDPVLKQASEQKLKKFISDMTGLDFNQINVVGGERSGSIPTGPDHDRWKLIYEEEFVTLDRLFPEGNVLDKLNALDDMCARLGGSLDMKIKVHYFFRTPNNGLYVLLNNHSNGAFKIYKRNGEKELTTNELPMLELNRCTNCGEYIVVGRLNDKNGIVEPIVADEHDMFDLEENDSKDGGVKTVVFGLTDQPDKENLQPYIFSPNQPDRLLKGVNDSQHWHLVANVRYRCPHCNKKLTREKVQEHETETVVLEDNTKIRRLRVSGDFISRIIAHPILNETDIYIPKSGDPKVLHNGQQYLSFADSRQLAATATLNQNLEQERIWFYSTIYHELSKRVAESEKVIKEIEKLKNDLMKAASSGDFAEVKKISTQIEELQKKADPSLSWKQLANFLLEEPMTKVFCELFLKKNDLNGETVGGKISHQILEKYVHSIMVMYLAKRPTSASSPETMGLFHPFYPSLNNKSIPKAVEIFNNEINNPVLKISDDDWRNLLRFFIDFGVRINESYYLRLDDSNPLDIMDTNRFSASKPRRRTAKKPIIEEGKASDSRIVRFIADLYAKDKGLDSNNSAQKEAHSLIKPIIDALWEDLTIGHDAILTHGTTWSEKENKHVKDKEVEGGAFRINLTELHFKLYDKAWLCDVNSENGEPHLVALRPISYTFKDYSPYLVNNAPIKIPKKYYADKWEVFPTLNQKENTSEFLEKWASAKRSLLWENNLWGKNGIFAERLNKIHLKPDIFVQGEHTAQVDKSVARKRQNTFKNHGVNILACSTTMEMGVDLGSLEVVMLSSVPPQPSNYKQRAGRSGRNNKVKSACITLCPSDAIGWRTYFKPLENIINRQVEVPIVDLNSPQVVQRHVNSFLIREFGVFGQGNINQKVANFFTPFVVKRENEYLIVLDPLTNQRKQPSDGLGDYLNTKYNEFNEACSKPIKPELHNRLAELTKGTVLENVPVVDILKNAADGNKRCYNELKLKANDLMIALSEKGISDKYRKFINMKYIQLLDERLLTYWATNRFTPNANMPVSILELDLHAAGFKDVSKLNLSQNPRYSLREALSQYVPGNNVVIDGVVYVVRGVECTNMFQRIKTFETLYKNDTKTEIVSGSTPSISDPIIWSVNNEVGLEVVKPSSFLPDPNETATRIIDSNAYTRVSAQLIGANDWDDLVSKDHLFSMRDNRESGDAKILYYNEGLGHGFAYCTRCGRSVLEHSPANKSEHPEIPPFDMNPFKGSVDKMGKEKPAYHLAISGKQAGKICSSYTDYSVIHRNVIFGDLIQTDYCEIRIRHKYMPKWISERDGEFDLLTTLAIVFCQGLAETLGKERQAIDFAITPNGHICIFDTNPGGAGYSNQLKDVGLMVKVIKKAYTILWDAKSKHSKDLLLDKYTIRYLSHINIDSAIDWIEEEFQFSGTSAISSPIMGVSNSINSPLDEAKLLYPGDENLVEEIFNQGFELDLDNPVVLKNEDGVIIQEAFMKIKKHPVVILQNDQKDWELKFMKLGYKVIYPSDISSLDASVK